MAQEQTEHKLTLNERKNLTVTGVTEVPGFDDRQVVLVSGYGTLTVHGQGLQLKQLDGGQVRVEGEVSALVYENGGAARSFWGRLLG